MSRLPRKVAIGVLAAAVLAGGGAVLARQATHARLRLPHVSPAALIASALTALARGRPQSGSVSATVDLGLPHLIDLPGGTGPLSLLTGTHTLKVWRSADGLRVSVLEPAGEQALFVSHGHAWAWNFDSLTAYELGRLSPLARYLIGLLGAGGAGGPGLEGILRSELASVADTTRVEVVGTTSVAGRPAYRLVVAPRQRGTLVGAIEIDVDSETRLPLAVFVAPRGSDRPAISVQFTSVSFAAIDPHTFVFQPPPGVRVERVGARRAGGALFSGVRRMRTFGRAWASVLAVEVPPLAGSGLGGLLAGPFLQLQGPLLSIRVANRPDRSWILIGSVPMDRLRALEIELP
jgi:hypothetical protein